MHNQNFSIFSVNERIDRKWPLPLLHFGKKIFDGCFRIFLKQISSRLSSDKLQLDQDASSENNPTETPRQTLNCQLSSGFVAVKKAL